ncbi:unnamed protein product [Clonostachys rhizophaga]|uniref:RelA/SpoT domain-containing protein n=1 Tax=Clonostachys rhizophaga TaxID=160324 RepID=A0A9N9VT83_9HYPO|nr:unnamed protein product [Clonostachys rhizophaga]
MLHSWPHFRHAERHMLLACRILQKVRIHPTCLWTKLQAGSLVVPSDRSVEESFLFPNGPVERNRQLGLAEIEKFLQTYERLQAHWQVLKDCAIEIIKTKMKEKDIRGQVTGRVKDFESLKTKLLQRNSRAPYKDDEAILNDGLDFIGLRIALYLPDDQPKVELLLKEAFVYESTTTFDRDWDYRRPQAYRKRFGEYTADHVWVKLNKGGQLLYYKMFKEYQRDAVTGTSIIYQSQPLEVQLRSVLMDAWANLSHFLEYKHLDGALSGKEMQLLDAIKGQVEGAELLIDILHQEHNKRINNNKRRIDSVEDVNDIVTEYIPADLLHKIPCGDMSLLLKYLQMTDHATPYKLRKLMAEVSTRDDIRAGLAAWVRDYDPLPTTISYYITSRVLSHRQLFYTRNQRS